MGVAKSKLGLKFSLIITGARTMLMSNIKHIIYILIRYLGKIINDCILVKNVCLIILG